MGGFLARILAEAVVKTPLVLAFFTAVIFGGAAVFWFWQLASG